MFSAFLLNRADLHKVRKHEEFATRWGRFEPETRQKIDINGGGCPYKWPQESMGFTGVFFFHPFKWSYNNLYL